MGRNKSKHERKKYKEKMRKKARQANYKGVEFSFWRMLWYNKFTILTVAFIFCIPLIIKQCTPANREERIKKEIGAILAQRHEGFTRQFPAGFVLYALDDKYVRYLNTNDLPNDFSIQWDKARVVKKDHKNIRVHLPIVSPRYLNVGKLDLYANLSPMQGRLTQVSKIHGVELYSGIVEERQNILYCVLAIAQP